MEAYPKNQRRSQSETADVDFHGVSGTARSPSRDSSEVAHSASQQRASPQSGIAPRSSPGGFPTPSTRRVSDAQLLYCTLVQDGALPLGFLTEFEQLVSNVKEYAAGVAQQGATTVSVCEPDMSWAPLTPIS